MTAPAAAVGAVGEHGVDQRRGDVHRDPSLLVRDVMVRWPKTLPGDASVEDVRAGFDSERVHLVLLIEAGRLVTTLERHDIGPETPDHCLARGLGRLRGRVVARDAPLVDAEAMLARTGGRRLAVIDDEGTLVGLLCLKRTRKGFCSDADVLARACDRADPPPTSR